MVAMVYEGLYELRHGASGRRIFRRNTSREDDLEKDHLAEAE